MLVSDPATTRHWSDESPDLTDQFGRWLTETRGVRKLRYASSLHDFSALPTGSVAIANYDWLSNLLAGSHPFLSLIREAVAARRLGVPIWCPLVDVFGIRYSTYSSILALASEGANLICQNTPDEVKAFGLPRTVGPHLWQWPPSVHRMWSEGNEWGNRNGAAVAFSGDSRRPVYFPPLLEKLERRGIPVVKSNKNLSFEDYVAQAKMVKIVATTCWLQPFYLVGPSYYLRKLATGHITNRVWEALAAGATLLTNDTPAIRSFGLFPGEHFVAIPDTYDGWESWALPDEASLRHIACRGAARFRSIVGTAAIT